RQCIPWDPSRPIQSFIANESAKQKPQLNMVYQRNNSSIEWEPPRLGSTNFEKIRMEANAAKTQAEALHGHRKQQM
ncbi:hypothetical protein VP01_5783g1, partial [Puccinia sorghi]